MNKSIKGLLKSKVFYWNIVTSGLEIANLFAPMLPSGSLMIVNAMGNVALRFLTTTSLAGKVE